MTAELLPVLSALACAEPHPTDPAVLCSRLDGHPLPHTADGLDPWRAEPEPTEENP